VGAVSRSTGRGEQTKEATGGVPYTGNGNSRRSLTNQFARKKTAFLEVKQKRKNAEWGAGRKTRARKIRNNPQRDERAKKTTRSLH